MMLATTVMTLAVAVANMYPAFTVHQVLQAFRKNWSICSPQQLSEESSYHPHFTDEETMAQRPFLKLPN